MSPYFGPSPCQQKSVIEEPPINNLFADIKLQQRYGWKRKTKEMKLYVNIWTPHVFFTFVMQKCKNAKMWVNQFDVYFLSFKFWNLFCLTLFTRTLNHLVLLWEGWEGYICHLLLKQTNFHILKFYQSHTVYKSNIMLDYQARAGRGLFTN